MVQSDPNQPSHDASGAALESALNDDNAGCVEVSPGYLELCTQSFCESRKLGQGAFGAVYHGVDARIGRTFAVKRLIGGTGG